MDRDKYIRRPRKADFEELMKRTSHYMDDGEFRSMLDNVTPRCHIEAWSTHQYGEVLDIIRDRYGIPVCFKVRYEVRSSDDILECWGYDYVPATAVSFYESWDSYVPSDEYTGCLCIPSNACEVDGYDESECSEE